MVASRESTLASRGPLDRLCEGVRCSEPECIECGMAVEVAVGTRDAKGRVTEGDGKRASRSTSRFAMSERASGQR